MIQHKEDKNMQRDAFKTLRDSLQNNECIIVLDFKENIKINHCPEEVTSYYRGY